MTGHRVTELTPAVPGELHTLDAGGGGAVQLYAREPGGERPILLVHTVNAAASAYEIRPIYERLHASRAVYTLDLPGFGRSERIDQLYTPRMMTDAVLAAVAWVRARHDDQPIDALAVSLACEFLARAATEQPDAFHTLGLVSPTGLDRRRRTGPAGSTLGIGWVHGLVHAPLWSRTLFGGLTRPGVIRYFLERTWGRKKIDEGLHAYCVETTRVPGAEHAPISFLSGHLFSGDATTLYEGLTHPVWVGHGIRGDFIDFRGAEALAETKGWQVRSFPTGALPHFEVPLAFLDAYETFLDAHFDSRIR